MKKYALIIFSFVLMLAPCPLWSAGAQDRSVKVTVDDELGPLAGVSVLVKGTINGGSTDADGVVTIEGIDESSVLVVSCIGYATQEITVGDRAEIEVTLSEDSMQLDDIVVVGYGTQKKESLTSAISSVRAEDVTKTKQNNVVTSLQGKVPGLLIRQSGGTPGSFAADISLRGYGTPIIVIDGVVRSDTYSNSNKGISTDLEFSQLNPEDIESISVLKDASASIYGMGAGNGVIMITTKKGSAGSKPSVYYSNVFSLGNPKMPKEVGIVDYMKMSNEMADVAKFTRPYTDEQIEEYANGTKQGFSWWDAAMRKFSFSQTHNVSVRGGSDFMTYFLSGSFNNDRSIYRSDNNFKYRRFTLRGNFTFNLAEGLTMDYQTSFRSTFSADPANDDVYNEKSAMLFNYIAFSDRLTPATVKDNPNHYTYQGQSPTENPIAMMNHDLNYTDKRGRAFTNTVNLRYKAPFLKGLELFAQGAYDFYYDGNYTKKTIYPLYDYETDEVMGYGGDENSYRETIRERERLYGRVQANYNASFGKHDLAAMLAAEVTRMDVRNMMAKRLYGDIFTHPTISSGLESTASNSGTRTSTATAGYLGRVNYEYDNRYLVEVMARYDGTYIYQRGHRWGFFPSYSLGWRISEEPFIKDNIPWLSSLKIRWSDGKTGLTQGRAYAYESGYVAGNTYVFTPGSMVQGYVNDQIANTILTWADVRMQDIGVDWNIFNDMFSGSFDYFWRTTKGIAGTSSGSTPTILGATVPQINVDSRLNVGMELSLSHRNKVGDFDYYVTVTGTLARTKNLHVESQATTLYPSAQSYWGGGFSFGSPGASSQNRWTDYHALWYYGLAGGRFGSWEEIYDSDVKYDANAGMQTTVIGQYKLLDTNQDGYISGADVLYKWGERNPPLQFGLNFGFTWKNLDFNMVWQGATMNSKIIWLLHTFGFGGYNNIYEMYTDRWHVAEEGADPYDPDTEWIPGYWPALMDASDANNWRPGMYDAPSDFTQIDATYFRLKSFEIGYTIPRKVMEKIGLRSARVFVGGTNWLTICSEKMRFYDPEAAASMQSNTMPLMRTVNFGLSVTF